MAVARGAAVALAVALGVAVAFAALAETAFFEFSFSRVCFPALPSAVSPLAFWKAMTAFSVAGPKSPSTWPL